MASAITVFKIAGISIKVHFTWFIILGLIWFTLAFSYLPSYETSAQLQWTGIHYWLGGLGIALLMFTSVVLHELAHSFVAKARGINVKSITLFILGGVSNLEREPKSAGEEFSIAIVGPFTSAVLGGISWVLWQFVFSESSLTNATLQLLMQVNFIVAIFNLLPGFPLDGGRVLRAIIWGSTDNEQRATAIAVGAGQVFGGLIILGGAIWAFTVAPFNGIWIALIGFFIMSSAGGYRRERALRQALSGTMVARVMRRNVKPVLPTTRVSDIVDSRFFREAERSVLVCDRIPNPPELASISDPAPRLLGIVSLSDVRNLPRDQWSTTEVQVIMTKDLRTVEPSSDLMEAFGMMAEHRVHQLPVCSRGELVGIVDRMRVMQYIHTTQRLGA